MKINRISFVEIRARFVSIRDPLFEDEEE